MKVPFELYVAVRYLSARRKQASLASTSLISILGVFVGVTALVIALALMTGLQGELRDRIVGSAAHVYVWKVIDGGFSDYQREAETLATVPRVMAAAPSIQGKALARTRHGDVFITVKGIDPYMESQVTDVATSVYEGRLVDLVDRNLFRGPEVGGLVIGAGAAERLGVFVGDDVSVLTNAGSLSPMGILARPRRLKVVGIFRLGLLEYDTAYGFVTLDVAKELFNKDSVEMMELRVDDLYASREVANSIPEVLGPAYVTEDWSQLNQALFSALWLEKTAISIAIGLIVVVAALHIVASLIMLVMERSRDIAILKTMGTSRKTIRRIFMLQGLIIGTIGTFGGGAVGLAVSTLMDRYRLFQLPMELYQISYLPFTVEIFDFVSVIVIAMLVCFVATLYPSRQAASLAPAEALRYQ